jgi:methyl-accepting chemotaxis protein
MEVSMKNASFSIEKVFSSVFNDLLYLSQRKELSITKDFSLKDERIRQLNDFKSFVSNKKIYDQLRYIDKKGQEILRVNYNKGNVISVEENKLQSKAGSYYVDDALDLGKGQIYISRFDLNKEKGKVENPIKPMIRFVTPYMNSINQLDGLIVFNYLGENLINDLKEADQSVISNIQVINEDGYYLYSGEESKDWAFMTGEEKGFFKDHPEAWKAIKTNKNYNFKSKDGIFHILPVDPDKFAENLVGKKMNQNMSNNFYVIVHVQEELIKSVYRDAIIKGIIIFLITAIIGLILVKLYINKKDGEIKHKKTLEENLEFNKTVVDKIKSSANIISKVSSEIYNATEDANEGLEHIVCELNNVTTSINENASTIDNSNNQIEEIADK